MKKRVWAVLCVSILSAVAAATVVASNMGFKYTKSLEGPGTMGSLSGTQDLGLPFIRQLGLDRASDLRNDILAAGAVNATVSRFDPTTGGFTTYAGLSFANDFPLRPAEAYRIKVDSDTTYVVMGAHDPGIVVQVDGPGTAGSLSGTSSYAYPYHSVAETASQLRDEILAQATAPTILSISRFDPQTGGLITYAGISTANDFLLTPGEGYILKTSRDVAYVPDHY